MLFNEVFLRFPRAAPRAPCVADPHLSSLSLPPLSCFCPLQTTQDMTMTLSQSLSLPQVAQVFPLFLRYVHVSTVSRHANRILHAIFN